MITDMNKRWALVIISLVLLVFCGNAQEKKHKLKITDLSFIGLASKKTFGISDTVANLSFLGDGTKKLKMEGADPAWNIWRYSWNGVTVDAFEGNGAINFIEISDGNFSSSRGVKIGDNREKVVQVYGEPDVDQNDVIGYLYLTEDSVWGLDFYFDSTGINRVVIGRDD